MQTVFEKIASGMQSTAVDDDAATHTTEEMQVIEAYKNSTDSGLRERFSSVINGTETEFFRQKISDVSDRQAQDAEKLLGGDYSGYTNNINSNGIRHIMNEHGPVGSVDQSLGNLDDAARVGYVLDNYDTVEVATYDSGDFDTSAEFRDANNEPAPMLRYSKKVNGTYFVVEAIPESRFKKFWVVSAYMQKNTDDLTQARDVQSPANTPEASLPSQSSANGSIAQTVQAVKGEEANASRLPDWAAYEAAHKGERYEYDPLEGGVDQTADFELWRDTTYFDAQEYSDTELAEQVEQWQKIRDNASEENKNRAIAQYHLDAYEYVQAQRAQKNAAVEQRNGGMQNAEILNDGSQRNEGLGARGQSRAVESGASRSISRGEARTQAAIIRDLKTNGRAHTKFL